MHCGLAWQKSDNYFYVIWITFTKTAGREITEESHGTLNILLTPAVIIIMELRSVDT